MGVYFLTNEDEKNYIKSINGVAPDESGNVEVAVSDSGGNVAYDEAQNLTEEQKAQARENIGAQPAGNYLTEVPDGYAKTDDIPTDEEIIQLIKNNAPESSGGGIAVTGAKVGQTVKIAEVDENGVPTAWEPTDFPSGGANEVWEEILNATITEDVGGCTFTEDMNGQPFRLKKASVLARIHGSNSATGGWINLDVSDGTNVLQVSQIPSGFAATEGQVNYRSFKTDVTLRETESFTMTFQSQNTSSAKDNLNNWNGVTSTFTSRKNPLKWISRFSFRCNGLAMGANTEIFIYGVRA